MTMRVYLPATLPVLAAALAHGDLGPAPLAAHAVTPALRQSLGVTDLEELEYAATLAAAEASLRLLAADHAAPTRRLVLAADVPDSAVSATTDDEQPSAIRVDQPVPMAWVVCAQVDDPDAGGDVAAAAAVLTDADAGDDEAALVVEALEDHALQWYAAQELPTLAAGPRAR